MEFSESIRDTLPIINILKEASSKFPEIKNPNPNYFCKVFEDNSGAIDIATNHKYRPRTKHIAVKFHHFHQYTNYGLIKISKIDTKDQEADILTKPVTFPTLQSLRTRLIGW